LNVDLRTSATVVALNEGIMNETDVLIVAEKLYFYQTDDPAYQDDGYHDISVAYDPKVSYALFLLSPR
jgi:hypothetical protein